MNKTNKLLVLDKDGTLVKPASGHEFVQHPQDQVLLPGVAERIEEYAAAEWSIAIASNQGGVAAGYKTLEDVIAEMRFCVRLLEDELQMLEIVEMALMCPDFEGQQCWDCREGLRQDLRDVIELHTNQFTKHLVGTFRKPGSGMLEAAAIAAHAGFAGLSTKWENVLMVGDRAEDQGAANAAGVNFMWADEWRKRE